jgi:hypothetical protein
LNEKLIESVILQPQLLTVKDTGIVSRLPTWPFMQNPFGVVITAQMLSPAVTDGTMYVGELVPTATPLLYQCIVSDKMGMKTENVSP